MQPSVVRRFGSIQDTLVLDGRGPGTERIASSPFGVAGASILPLSQNGSVVEQEQFDEIVPGVHEGEGVGSPRVDCAPTSGNRTQRNKCPRLPWFLPFAEIPLQYLLKPWFWSLPLQVITTTARNGFGVSAMVGETLLGSRGLSGDVIRHTATVTPSIEVVNRLPTTKSDDGRHDEVIVKSRMTTGSLPRCGGSPDFLNPSMRHYGIA